MSLCLLLVVYCATPVLHLTLHYEDETWKDLNIKNELMRRYLETERHSGERLSGQRNTLHNVNKQDFCLENIYLYFSSSVIRP